MNNCTIIEVENWTRREVFRGYQTFDNKMFCINFDSNIGNLYRLAKERKQSFFQLSLYAILKAANAVPQIRQRILNSDQVAEYEHIAVQTPIMTADELFISIILEYADTFAEFAESAIPLIEAAQKSRSTPAIPGRPDIITASCVPWFSFTAITQANFSFNQSSPVLAWGKMKPDGCVPISVQFNHSLMDGLHVGRFIAALEENFTHPETL